MVDGYRANHNMWNRRLSSVTIKNRRFSRTKFHAHSLSKGGHTIHFSIQSIVRQTVQKQSDSKLKMKTSSVCVTGSLLFFIVFKPYNILFLRIKTINHNNKNKLDSGYPKSHSETAQAYILRTE